MAQSRRHGWLCLVVLCAAHAAGSDASQRADQMLREGRFEEAVGFYQALSTEHPSDAQFRLALATALYSLGRYSQALRQLENVRAAETQNAKFWFLLGVTEIKLGEESKAVEALRHAASLDPRDPETAVELAATLLEARRFREAADEYQALAHSLPHSPKVWRGLATAQLALSEEAFDALKKSAPRSSYLVALAAAAAAESGDEQKAAGLYQKAFDAAPATGAWRSELAILRDPSASCGDKSYACRFAKGDLGPLGSEVSKLRTPEGKYWTTRVYSRLAQQSIECLTALPPSAEQHEMMAGLYTRNGRKTEAIAELREAVKLAPDDALAVGDLAEALWSDRQFDEAAALLDQLLKRAPDRANWQFELGDALFNTGKVEEAIPHLDKAVQLSPALLPAQAKLGEALLRMGDPAGALPHLERARQLDRDGSIHFQLASAYRKLGHTDAAVKAAERQKELARTSKGTAPQSPAN